jgi:UV DNA damage endonuclease
MPRRTNPDPSTGPVEVIAKFDGDNEGDSSSSGLRRSSRRSQPSSKRITIKESQGSGHGVSPHEKDIDSDQDDSSVMAEIEAEREGVQQAIAALARMERRLRRATKRQKLKIEESSVHTRQDFEEEMAFKPSIKVEGSSVKLERPSSNKVSLPTPDKDIFESDGEHVEGDDKAQDSNTSRPPAVNSTYLPLPWKGRLGYVG